jgi:UDP-galactopyranose mutase
MISLVLINNLNICSVFILILKHDFISVNAHSQQDGNGMGFYIHVYLYHLFSTNQVIISFR